MINKVRQSWSGLHKAIKALISICVFITTTWAAALALDEMGLRPVISAEAAQISSRISYLELFNLQTQLSNEQTKLFNIKKEKDLRNGTVPDWMEQRSRELENSIENLKKAIDNKQKEMVE